MSTELVSNNFLNDFLTYFQTQCLAGLRNLLPEAVFLVWVLGIIMLVMRLITEGHIFGGGAWTSYIVTSLKVGVFSYIVNDWENLTFNIVFKSFEVAGLTAGNIAKAPDPSSIFMTGFSLVNNVIAGVFAKASWQVVVGILPLLVIKSITCLLIILTFAAMSLMFFTAIMEFYVFASASIILVPFGMIPQLKSFFDAAVSGLFRTGVKYMTMLFILGIGQGYFSASNSSLAEDSGWQYLMKAAVGILVYAYMVARIPNMVSSMISGSVSSDSGLGAITGAAKLGAKAAIKKL
ncbi:MAG: trbL [Firmicutes bacterium]|nr:trbL [Bacillota bacterium]